MSSSHNKTNAQGLTDKRKNYRQQIRRQYLDEFLSKKRADCFGWSYQSYLNQNFSTSNVNHTQVQIDKPPSVFIAKSQNQKLKPFYTKNYFDQTNLLQKMIEQNDELFKGMSSFQVSSNFKYKNFYHFLIEVIKQSLDYKSFEKFQGNHLFVAHFQDLKHNIYQKLGEEIQNFLIRFHDISNCRLRQQNLAYKQSYVRLIYQMENFIECSNLQGEQYNDWPFISVQEQLIFLLKVFIEITYYDHPVKTGNILQTISENENRKIQEKYRTVLGSESQREEQHSNSVTKYLIFQSGLLQRLRFLIVFGHSQVNSDNKENDEHFEKQKTSNEKRRKQRQIRLILHLLLNMAFNVGSDILFETGIISELRCMLNQPAESDFRVKINSKLKNNKIAQIHRQIMSFMLEAFEMIKTQASIEYLSSMDSLSFVFETLIQVTKAKRQLDRQIEWSKQRVSIDRQFVLIQEDQQKNLNSDEDIDDLSSIKPSESRAIKELTRIGQKCIQSIDFHLKLGLCLTTNGKNCYLLKLKYLIVTDFDYEIFKDYQQGQQLLKKWQILSQ